MARIWYSVCGEGFGHATRSDAVLQELIKHHEVIITAYGKAYTYLKPRYKSLVQEIDGHTYVYEDNILRVGKSIRGLLVHLPYFAWKNLRQLRKLMTSFHPDVIITDFESASAYYGLVYRVPVINLDNIHALKEFKVKSPWYAVPGIKILQPKGNYYLIPSFVEEKVKGKTTIILPPLLRREVGCLKPSDKGYVLVYQTSSTYNRMIPVLHQMKKPCVVYGMGVKKLEKSALLSERSKTKRSDKQAILFKKFSEKEFLKDLAGATYVIMNGGFTLITEAFALKKPVLVIPVKNQIEQVYNGEQVKKHGLGFSAQDLTLDVVTAFERHLQEYQRNVAKLPLWKNKDALCIVERCIAELVAKKNWQTRPEGKQKRKNMRRTK